MTKSVEISHHRPIPTWSPNRTDLCGDQNLADHLNVNVPAVHHPGLA
jgi:hypothetical protein